jgi:hypothetical protein
MAADAINVAIMAWRNEIPAYGGGMAMKTRLVCNQLAKMNRRRINGGVAKAA